MSSFYLFWTSSVEHGWKAMSLGIIQSTNFDLKSFRFGFKTFLCFLMVSVSKFFGIDKSIGIGFVFFWYRKKYRYRFRKNLVSKKVSVSVSKIFVLKKDTNIHDLFHHLEP